LGNSRKYPYTYTWDSFLGFPKGRGLLFDLDSKGIGGTSIYDWKSAGMRGFHRWDFWSRKSTASSLKTLLLWTFLAHKYHKLMTLEAEDKHDD